MPEIWASSTRGDLMLDEAVRSANSAANRQTLVHACCDIATTVLPRVTGGETRPSAAITVARNWANNPASVTRGQLQTAAASAAAAAGPGASGAAARAAAFCCYVAIDALANLRDNNSGTRALAVADAAATAEGIAVNAAARTASLSAAAVTMRTRFPSDPR